MDCALFGMSEPIEPVAIPSDNRILYYGRDRDAFGFLSHFYPSPIELDGWIWPCVEYFYQAQKSSDRDYRRAIMEAESPGKVKRLAANPDITGKSGKHSWFRAHGKSPRADWHQVKLDIMRRADLAKYTQNPALRERLLATGDAELVEDSPSEPFWGIGSDGNGANWAGRVIMEVRAALRGA